MAKKDIGKILSSGSTKQRLLLIVEDNARMRYGQERLLTDEQTGQLSDSFKKPNELKLWNKWLTVDSKVANAIVNLQGLKFEILMHYSNLRGYILVWETIQEAELLTNHVLHEIKDPEERRRVSSQARELGYFLFSQINTDPEGYLDIDIDFKREENSAGVRSRKFSLWYVMNNVKKEAVGSVIRFKSWRQALLDYMEEEGFTVKTYKEIINAMNDDIHKPIIAWTKYHIEETMFIPDQPNSRANKLKAKYGIAPNIKELEPDQEIYDFFKNEYLGNE